MWYSTHLKVQGPYKTILMLRLPPEINHSCVKTSFINHSGDDNAECEEYCCSKHLQQRTSHNQIV